MHASTKMLRRRTEAQHRVGREGDVVFDLGDAVAARVDRFAVLDDGEVEAGMTRGVIGREQAVDLVGPCTADAFAALEIGVARAHGAHAVRAARAARCSMRLRMMAWRRLSIGKRQISGIANICSRVCKPMKVKRMPKLANSSLTAPVTVLKPK